MGLLSDAQGWLNDTLASEAVAGVSVVYARTGQSNLTFDAWLGRTLVRQDQKQPSGAFTVYGELDLLVPVAALTWGVPNRGDRATLTIGGRSITVESMPGPGEPPWRYSDPSTRLTYRIHMKRVS